MTRAAYQAAIEWAQETEIPLGLECDVHFSADDELICLHDLTLDRTSTSSGPAYQRTVAELKLLDFGSRSIANPEPEQRELITLRELMSMVRDARQDHDTGQHGDRNQAPQRSGSRSRGTCCRDARGIRLGSTRLHPYG